MKQIIRDFVPLYRSFPDTVDEEKVEYFSKMMNVANAIQIATYLQSVKVTKKQNPLDAMTYVNDNVVAMSLGTGNITLHTDKSSKKMECPGGVVDGITGPQAIAQLISVCSKMKMGKDAGERTFAQTNKLAPTGPLITAAANLCQMRTLNVTELESQATAFSLIPDEQYKSVVDLINPLCATTVLDGVDVPILTLITEDDEGSPYRGVATYPLLPTRYNLTGEYANVVKLVDRYTQGSTYPTMKRLGRKTWTGTPVDNFPCDHIVALHDAGVKPDSSILVVSSDTNLISLIRSNFGSKVFGVGNTGGAFVAQSECATARFDYVYYPKPIKFTSAASFEQSCRQFKEAFLKMTEIYATGTSIVHISPLAFYCKEFCEVFGVKGLQAPVS